jgi:cytochrome c oxidase subunit 4
MSSSHEAEHPKHPTTKRYVIIALLLFIITGVEFVIILPPSMQGTAIALAPLIILSLVKFYIVIMFYMHLRFENPLLTKIFYSGLGLGLLVAVALIGLFSGLAGTPREYASVRAVPYEGHGIESHSEVVENLIPTPVPSDQMANSNDTKDIIVGNIEAGEAVFSGSLGCVGCHTMEDLPGAMGVVGPNLTNIGTISGTRSSLSAEEYIKQSIESPAAYIVDTYAPVMPELRNSMTDEEFGDLVAYLLSKK